MSPVAKSRSRVPSRVHPDLLADLHFTSATIDDLAEVRHLVGAAMRREACAADTNIDTDRLEAYLAGPRYMDDLRGRAIVLGRLNGTVVTVGAWCPAPDETDAALMSLVLVHEMFRGLGIARALIIELERRVRAAGFAQVIAQTSPASEGLLTRHGFIDRRADHEIIATGVALPVVRLSKVLRAPLVQPLWSAVSAARLAIAGVEIRAGQQSLDFGRIGKSRSPVYSKAVH